MKQWMRYSGVAVAGMIVGSIAGTTAAGGPATSAATGAAPAPTVTVTAPAVTVTQTPEPPPVNASIKPADFRLGIKILSKKCFGSAGCNVTFRVVPKYVGTGSLPDGTVEVTYSVKGAEDPIINTLTIVDGTASFDSEEIASTSSGAKLTAVVTEVSVQ